MSRYRIDMPDHGADAGIDVQLDGNAEMTPELEAAFRELADLAFERMDLMTRDDCPKCGSKRRDACLHSDPRDQQSGVCCCTHPWHKALDGFGQ